MPTSRPLPRSATDPRPAAHRLTAASVAALPVLPTRYAVADTVLPGLEVRVAPSGAKSYAVRYRPKGSRTVARVTLGDFPTLTPDDARSRARQVRGAALGGADPAAALRARKAERAGVVTVAQLAARYLDVSAARIRPTTATLYRRLLDGHILPALGERPAADVLPADVARLHTALGAPPRPRRTTANQCVRLLSTLFRFAERDGLRPRGTNPAADVPRYAETRRERYLDGDQVRALLAALDRAERDGLPAAPTRRRPAPRAATAKHRPKAADAPIPANPYAVRAIRFALLTGMRRNEVLRLRWAEVDRARGLLILADTKTGRSVRPLSPAAVAELAGCPRVVGSPYVFPSPRDARQPLGSVGRLWDAVRHAAGLDGVADGAPVRLHDLRHTAASLMLQGGATLAEVGRALGHASVTATARYAHIADAGAQRAAGILADAVAAAAPAPGAAADSMRALPRATSRQAVRPRKQPAVRRA